MDTGMASESPDRRPPAIRIALPGWAHRLLDGYPPCRTDEDKMRLAVALARENVARASGGPFGAAVFQQPGNRLVAGGVNQVERRCNSALHAEVVAIMLAEARLRTYTLGAPGLPPHELVTSCEPCAMCLGAALWSGVRRLVCGAGRADAAALGFEEGPVFPESYRYLESRGIQVVRLVLADEARAVLALYRQRQGRIYNG
jgi:tRNA(Arg) A34 adenosine deaminase TadA